MARARKCDICHNYYDVPEIDASTLEPWNNTSIVRILRLNPEAAKEKGLAISHDVMHFDACEKCLQDIVDFILTRQADVIKGV